VIRQDSKEGLDIVSANCRRYRHVWAAGGNVLSRAKLSALRSRGKCVADYSPPASC